MSKLIPITLDDGLTIYVESTSSGVEKKTPAIKEASTLSAGEKALKTAKQLTTSIKSFCGHVVKGFNGIKEVEQPTKVSVEFGLSLSIEGDVYIVKGKGESSIRVTAEWQLSK